ncbi:hypothetical protein QNI16_32920 [Cytophagaceae bacterium YF14B1]|uniref:Uncharacterized protein n=1 Tax=Xanthocytophaga flava TaxID=3048013 RepID=A0AAE3UAA4_9BACT|nr:hypothetical protein [Xanthocytophaga flavus]MDJ1485341.1 hypothetical protein [Xanthocytophaga flavus]
MLHRLENENYRGKTPSGFGTKDFWVGLGGVGDIHGGINLLITR